MALISMYLSELNNHSVFEKQQEIQAPQSPSRSPVLLEFIYRATRVEHLKHLAARAF